MVSSFPGDSGKGKCSVVIFSILNPSRRPAFLWRIDRSNKHPTLFGNDHRQEKEDCKSTTCSVPVALG